MKNCRITVLKQAYHADLAEKYEHPQAEPCDMRVGDIYITDTFHKPAGFCESAWANLAPFVLALSSGAEEIYGKWMKNPRSAMVSCNDGFRPRTFLVEAIDE